ncbi:MAG: hypothetical protein HZB33_02745 [Nitrospirae bacterium]|nr:hypothetical protein [Nitrospirota bacterium]
MKSGKLVHYILLSLSITLLILLPSFSSADPLDDWHWRSPLPQGNDLNDVKYGNGTFVTVGLPGTVMTSPDGISWTVRASGTARSLNGVAFGNNGFVLVGESGTILTSPDGISWTVRASGTAASLYGVTFGGDIFVAVGDNGTILTSPDGVAWTERVSGTSTRLQNVIFGNNTYVSAGIGADMFISSDAVTWRTVPTGTAQFIVPRAYGNGVFVATFLYHCTFGCLTGIMISSDGETWTSTNGYFEPLTFEGGLFVGRFETSSDGLAWTPTSGGVTTNSVNGITYGGGLFVAVGQFGRIETSPDASVWTGRNEGIRDSISDIAFANGTFVAAGDPTLFTSQDGATWTAGYPFFARTVTTINNTFVALGPAGILMSPDGLTWTTRVDGIGLQGIAFGNGTYVAVGDTILTSPDGMTWTIRPLPLGSSFAGAVAFGNNMFVVVGAAGDTILTSPDGVTWTPRASVTPSRLSSVAFGNGVFVAVGSSVTSEMRDPAIFTSVDGVIWTPQNAGVDSFDLRRVTFAGGLFVAVGSNGAILTSVNGTTWTLRASGTFNALNGAGFGNGTFVAVGESGTILQTGRVISPDIKANNSGGPVTLRTGDTLSITAGLDAGAGVGINADWWVIAETPIGVYYFAEPGTWYPAPLLENIQPTYQGPLYDHETVEVLNVTGLPPGVYRFYFGADTHMNARIDYDRLYFNYVTVNVE